MIEVFTIAEKILTVKSIRIEQWEDTVIINGIHLPGSWGTEEIFGVMATLEKHPELVQLIREL